MIIFDQLSINLDVLNEYFVLGLNIYKVFANVISKSE